jgi:Zn-finger nucleic acid-binding protein
MNCENCGAPMRLAPDHAHFICSYCGSVRFPEANYDGIRILGELSDLECPVCKTRLVTAAVDTNQLLHCPNCRGCLIDQPIFSFIVQYSVLFGDEREIPPRQLNREELNRPLRCARCGRDMDTHIYGGPGYIVIDTCNTCQLIWLDYGELRRVLSAPRSERQEDDDIDE